MRTLLILTAVLVVAAVAAVAIAQEPADPPGKKDDAKPQRRAPRGGGDFFTRHDTDKDGKLTLDELTAPSKKLMTDADKDGNAVLTREEYDEAMKKQREDRRKKAEEARGDKPEGEGRPEGAPPGGRGGGAGGAGGLGGRQRPSIEDTFKTIDTDANGSLSLEEFKKHSESRMRRFGGRGGRGGGRQPR